MNKLNIVATTVLSAALVPWAAGEAEAAIVRSIDPLTTPQIVSRTTGGNSPANNVLVPGTIFGNNITRRINLTSSGRGNSTVAIPTPNFGPGISFSNDTGVNGVTTIQYRGTRSGGTFLPVDLTVGGLADRVSLGIILNDVPLNAASTFRVTLRSGTAPAVTVTKTSAVDYFDPNFPLPLEFLFSEFSGINPTAITSFSLVIDPPVNGDVALDFLGVGDNRPFPSAPTPEPASMLGLLAVASVGSRFLKKSRRVK